MGERRSHEKSEFRIALRILKENGVMPKEIYHTKDKSASLPICSFFMLAGFPQKIIVPFLTT